MSVDKTTYILYGTRIEYEEYKKIEEQHEDDFDWYDDNFIGNKGEEHVGFLPDGMSGGYCYVGREIHSENAYYDDYDTPVEICILSEEEKKQVKEQVEALIGHEVGELKYLFVSHYS